MQEDLYATSQKVFTAEGVEHPPSKWAREAVEELVLKRAAMTHVVASEEPSSA